MRFPISGCVAKSRRRGNRNRCDPWRRPIAPLCASVFTRCFRFALGYLWPSSLALTLWQENRNRWRPPLEWVERSSAASIPFGGELLDIIVRTLENIGRSRCVMPKLGRFPIVYSTKICYNFFVFCLRVDSCSLLECRKVSL